MKRLIIHFPAGLGLLLPLLLACQARETNAPEGNIREIYHAETEGADSPETRVSMDAAYRAFWNADDRISVFARTTQNRQCRFLGEEGDVAGEFYAVTVTDADAPALPRFYAASPYREDNAVSAEGVLTMTLPAAQSYRSGRFDPAALPMVAMSETRRFSFRNVACLLGVQLFGDGVNVRSITLKGHALEALAGRMLVTPGDAPALSFLPEEASTQVTLTAATPVALDPGTPTLFWFVLPPVSFSSGLTLTVTDADGNTFEKALQNKLTLERNHAYRLSAIEAVPVPPGPPSAPGIYHQYRSGGDCYVYAPGSEQISIYEAEGQLWERFLDPSTLRMYEFGPVPADVAEGDTVEATLTETLAGEQIAQTAYSLRVLSLTGGILTLGGTGENYVVLRF